MARHWGLGPVFQYEWRVASRRWQMYAGRSLFVTGLLITLTWVWLSIPFHGLNGGLSIAQRAVVAEKIFTVLVGCQLTIVLLVSPALTAGSICRDKTRGLLTHLLLTDLSNTEIVLGKLAHRLIPALGFVFVALPVLALSIFLGGIAPGALLGAFLVTLGVCVLSCTLALTLSIWANRTHEVLLAVYGVWIAGLLAYPLGESLVWGWYGRSFRPYAMDLLCLDPYWVAFLPYEEPRSDSLGTQALFLGVTLGLAGVFTALSIWRIRSVVLDHSNRVRGQRTAWLQFLQRLWRRLPGPSVGISPVVWREWHFGHGSAWGRTFWLVYLVGALICAVVAIAQPGGSRTHAGQVGLVAGTMVALGLLFVCVDSVTRLAQERVRGTLDLLLVTPVSTPAILRGKWWGTFRLTALIALAPSLLAFAVSQETGAPRVHVIGGSADDIWVALYLTPVLILSYGAAFTSLGMYLAIRIARIGHAVACCLIMYVGACVVWPFLMLTTFDNSHGAILATGSPLLGSAYPVLDAESRSYSNPDSLPLTVGWTVIYILNNSSCLP